MRVSLVALVAITGLGATARADDPPSPLDTAEKLTITDLLKAAVAAAPELEAAALSVEQARARQIQAWAGEDLNASLSVSKSTTDSPVRSQKNFNIGLQASQLLPTNGKVSFSASGLGQENTEPRANTTTGATNLQFQLTQPILTFGPTVERAQIRSAKHQLSAAMIRRSATARDYVARVVQQYWQLALAWRQLDVQKASLAAAEKQYAGIKKGLQSGSLAKSEGVPFEQAIASRKIDILNVERQIITQSLALRTLVGIEVTTEAPAIRPSELPAPSKGDIKTDEVVAQALELSDDLHAAMEDVKAAEAIAAGAKRTLLPDVELQATAQYGSNSPSFSQSVGDIRFQRSSTYTLGATVTLPVQRSEVRGAYANARAQLSGARFNVFATRKTIASNVIQLSNDLRALRKSIDLSQQVVQLAAQNLEAEQRKLEFGKSTSNEVVRRQGELDSARLQLETVNADEIVAEAQLEAAVGKILEHYGIRLLDLDAFPIDTSSR